MKRIFAVAIISAFVLALAACSEPLTPEGQELKDSLTSEELQHIEAAAKREGVDVNQALNEAAAMVGGAQRFDDF
ncbi:hypothetical protein [Thioalkalivibrio sp. ALMg13-2]|uniref:hypothetical protein n=1 Tax=Thioalkalivibrio sp. ALMg13-2 TaxID=1158167 RepID=UPI0003754993|nr:hypothetical protein [Thioalkalivibrio sp. ALMg13-2]